MAGFNTAVTGIKATTTALDVTGNNIANASTAGFKSTRAEFSDIYSTQVVGAGSQNVAGAGVLISDLSQDFSGGTIEFTNSNLDLAVNGSGFFQLSDGNNGFTYTRAGAFELDKEGFIVSKNGKYLRGYGLDAQGNQEPLKNLKVEEKESPPHPTENINLSVNLEPDAELGERADYYSRTNTNSYAYTTTIETYDSLGNTQSVKFNYVEQKPQKEVYTFVLGTAGQIEIPDANGGNYQLTIDTTAVTGNAMVLPGLAAGEAPLVSPALSLDGASTVTVLDPTTTAGAAAIEAIQTANPAIDAQSMRFYTNAAGDTVVTFETNAKHNGVGDLVVRDHGGTTDLVPANQTSDGNQPLVDAGEEVRITFNAAAFAHATTAGGLTAETTINIGGVDIVLPEEMVIDEAGTKIVREFEEDIKAANPGIDSVTYDEATNELVIRWRPDVGDVADSDFSVSANTTGAAYAAASAVFDVNQAGAGTSYDVTFDAANKRDGDNSYQGVYRVYAYLNDEVLLDMGKPQDPGEAPNATGTEPGPILLEFSPNNGALLSVNGQPVRDTDNVPNLTILGADLANPDDALVDGDIDNLRGVQLDISGSTRWNSPTIVKTQAQDGYAKGDLIGVSFDERGYMVAAYSNGQRKDIGIVALATFESQSGLQPAGDTEWVPTLDSGQANLNPPGTGLNGSIRSGALEQSNVDLSAELVKLIEFQRNYQANSKTLETLNTVTQSILQI